MMNDIIQKGGKAAVAIGDLSEDAPAERVAKAATQAFDGIDILINNGLGAKMAVFR